MNTFFLIGHPLGHSLSPVIHTELFRLKNIDAKYELKDIKPEALSADFSKLKKSCGFNVTIPHKINIIPFLNELDEKAMLFGAVNTVKCTDTIKGYNTDCIGFIRSLEAEGIALGKKTLLCGAGGVSRMFAFECVLHGCDLTVAVRNSGIGSAKKIKSEIKEKLNKDIRILTYDNITDGYDLIINGTPVGMYPNTNKCIIPEEIVKNSNAVFDAIYNPCETLLIKYAKNAGIKHLNGLPMLVWQAAAAQEIWLDVKFTKDEIKHVIKIAEKELEK